jgi:CheY-like chemotaxis protein
MPRVRLFHWKAAEAAPLLDTLRSLGYEVDYQEKWGPEIGRAIKLSPPAAILIDLSRLPSHGREIAVYLRANKTTRVIPIVFVDGAAEKVDIVRNALPDATYTAACRLPAALRKAVATALKNPVVPAQMMDRYAGRTTAQKLGVVEGSSVALFDAPRNYAQVIGELPPDVNLEEEPLTPCAVTLWFVRDADAYLSELPRMRAKAAATKFWILWPKAAAVKSTPALKGITITETTVREYALDVGLVDYKICSVDATWSALCFAGKGIAGEKI